MPTSANNSLTTQARGSWGLRYVPLNVFDPRTIEEQKGYYKLTDSQIKIPAEKISATHFSTEIAIQPLDGRPLNVLSLKDQNYHNEASPLTAFTSEPRKLTVIQPMQLTSEQSDKLANPRTLILYQNPEAFDGVVEAVAQGTSFSNIDELTQLRIMSRGQK